MAIVRVYRVRERRCAVERNAFSLRTIFFFRRCSATTVRMLKCSLCIFI